MPLLFLLLGVLGAAAEAPPDSRGKKESRADVTPWESFVEEQPHNTLTEPMRGRTMQVVLAAHYAYANASKPDIGSNACVTYLTHF